jgi:hypothetical protein
LAREPVRYRNGKAYTSATSVYCKLLNFSGLEARTGSPLPLGKKKPCILVGLSIGWRVLMGTEAVN